MHCAGSDGGLFALAASLFPIPFPGQRLFDPKLLTRLQIKRVPLHVLDDFFLQDFSLEAPQRVFQGLAFLKPYFSQWTSPKLAIAILLLRTSLLAFAPSVGRGVHPLSLF